MSSLSRLLEDFGRPGPATPDPGGGLDWDKVEALKAEAYESGYKAGWEDSGKQRDGDQARIAEDFARNLQDLSFTYHEARSHVLTALAPCLRQMVDLVLPRLARDTLGDRVLQEVESVANDAAGFEIGIVVAPENQGQIESILDQDLGLPLRIRADDTLADGQVYLKFGDEERQIDMDDVLSRIRGAVDAFLDDKQKEAAHG